MTGTFELSYYPFRDAYPDSVIEVLAELRQIPGITIDTNGMSTVLIGDFETIWNTLGDIAARRLGQEDAAIILKVARGRREFID